MICNIVKVKSSVIQLIIGIQLQCNFILFNQVIWQIVSFRKYIGKNILTNLFNRIFHNMKDCKKVFHNKLGINLIYIHNKSAKHSHSSEILSIFYLKKNIILYVLCNRRYMGMQEYSNYSTRDTNQNIETIKILRHIVLQSFAS